MIKVIIEDKHGVYTTEFNNTDGHITEYIDAFRSSMLAATFPEVLIDKYLPETGIEPTENYN